MERIIGIINQLKDWTSEQIESLARVSDYRIETIDHSHNALVINGPHDHGSGAHRHDVPGIDYPTGYEGEDGHVSRQLTYSDEYSNDRHPTHPHVEDSIIYEREHPEDAMIFVSQYVATPICTNTPGDNCGQDRCAGSGTYHQCWNCNLENNCDELCNETCKHQCSKAHPNPNFKKPCWMRPANNTISDALQKELCQLRIIQKHMYTDIRNFENNYGSPWTELYMMRQKMNVALSYARSHSSLQWIGQKHSLLSLLQNSLSYIIDAKSAIIHYHDWIQRAYDHKFNDNNPSIYLQHKEFGSTIGNIHQPIRENVHINYIGDEDPGPF